MAKSKLRAGAQRAGTGAKTSSDSTQSDNDIYRRNRRKKIIVCKKKKKNITKGFVAGGTHCNGVPHALQEGYKSWIPHPGTSLWYVPTHQLHLVQLIQPRICLNGTSSTFSEVTIGFAGVALFQAEGGLSFVPLRVLLPFSLEETAAPAERREERRRDIRVMWRRVEGDKEAEESFRAAV